MRNQGMDTTLPGNNAFLVRQPMMPSDIMIESAIDSHVASSDLPVPHLGRLRSSDRMMPTATFMARLRLGPLEGNGRDRPAAASVSV